MLDTAVVVARAEHFIRQVYMECGDNQPHRDIISQPWCVFWINTFFFAAHNFVSCGLNGFVYTALCGIKQHLTHKCIL